MLLRSFLLLAFVLFFNPGTAWAQTGTWTPAGADPRYPRTLLKAADLPAVRTALATPTPAALYASLYRDMSGPPPADNSSSNGRRARATFAKNAAFVVLMDRLPASAGAAQALPAAERTARAATARELLENVNTSVESYTAYTEWQWRSKELIDYLVAYDLLRGAGETEATLAPAKARLQTFAGNLHRQATASFLGLSFFRQVKNNHALMTAAALGMAAVVLNDATSPDANLQPQSWISTGLFNLDNVLWQDAQRQSDPAAVAGYAEGPYYFKYAFLNCLPFFRAMGHFAPAGALPYTFGGSTRSIPNPYFDARYERLYQWATAIMLPDGRLPALEDSYVDMAMPELALTGKSQYVKPLYLSQLAPTQMNSLAAQLTYATVDMRAAYLAANLTPSAPNNAPLTVLPQSGNLIFRSGNDSLASYLHLYGQNGPALANSGGHGQADASSFLLHAQGQLLALDPGYLSYSRRSEVGQASSHNLILVDGAGPALGAAGSANDAPASITHTFQTPGLSYGEVRTAYRGATITRKTLFVRNRYFLLADFVEASAPHTYRWQLHGYGLEGGTAATGTFTDNLKADEASWHKNGATLLAHVTATGGASAYQKVTNVHELGYNAPENHTTLLVDKSGAARTQFLTALYPHTSNQLRLATTSTAGTAALAATSDYLDVAFAQADTVLTTDAGHPLSQPISADGRLNFYSTTATGQFAQLLLEQGTTLRSGGQTVVHTSKRLTLSWQRTDAGQYEGYASRAATLTLALSAAPSTVSGPGVVSYGYDAATQQLTLVLREASSFRVGLAALSPAAVLPVALVSFVARRSAGGAVQLSWQTATERHNRGFSVQRRTAAEADFQTIGFVAGAGQSTAVRRYAFPDDAAPASITYYRLRQTDHDGATHDSPVAVVAKPELTAQFILYPNPADTYFELHTAGLETTGKLQILNAQGQTVLTQPLHRATRIHTQSLPAGVYYVRFTAPNASASMPTQKIIVLH